MGIIFSRQSALTINRTINDRSRYRSSFLKNEHQIVIDRTFKINEDRNKISNTILSIVEESYPFEKINNIRWISQQIFHFVCANTTKNILNSNQQIYEGTQHIKIDGDGMKMFIDFYSFMYGSNGEMLKLRNFQTIKIRLIMGFGYVINDKITMRSNTAKILNTKKNCKTIVAGEFQEKSFTQKCFIDKNINIYQ